jgi:hypothetical protein
VRRRRGSELGGSPWIPRSPTGVSLASCRINPQNDRIEWRPSHGASFCRSTSAAPAPGATGGASADSA